MLLKEKIQSDFISAMKSGDSVTKNALSFLKAKIVEAEKASPGNTFSDDDVFKVITKMVKQRKQSIEAYFNGGREDLVVKENLELDVLMRYMPAEITENEIRLAINEIISKLDTSTINENAKAGRLVGEVMKHFKGMADPKMVNAVVRELI